MNLQGTHADSGQGRDTLIYTENDCERERENRGRASDCEVN